MQDQLFLFTFASQSKGIRIMSAFRIKMCVRHNDKFLESIPEGFTLMYENGTYIEERPEIAIAAVQVTIDKLKEHYRGLNAYVHIMCDSNHYELFSTVRNRLRSCSVNIRPGYCIVQLNK